MKTKFIRSSFASVVVVAVSLFSAQANAADCKGKAQNACSSDTACSWVKGYERKDGRTVSSFCRAKPQSKAASILKKSTAKLSLKPAK